MLAPVRFQGRSHGRSQGRSQGLDLFKTALVWGMVATHVVQLLAPAPPGPALAFAGTVNLLAFSGFLLAFGIGTGASRDRPRPLAERLRAPLLLLLAVWASSFGFALLVDREPLTRALALDVLTTRRLFGWSEFLTTFLVLSLVIALARGWLLRLAGHPRALLALAAGGLASTLVATERPWPLIGGVLGHWGYANFPLGAYLPWFLAGLRLGREGRRLDGGDLLLGLACSLPLLLAWAQWGEMPDRFPPSAAWVLGAGLPLAALLWLCQRAPGLPAWLLAPGRHVLLSLVASNLVIFAARRLWGQPLRDGPAILVAALGLLALVTLLAWARGLWHGGGRRGAAAPQGRADPGATG